MEILSYATEDPTRAGSPALRWLAWANVVGLAPYMLEEFAPPTANLFLQVLLICLTVGSQAAACILLLVEANRRVPGHKSYSLALAGLIMTVAGVALWAVNFGQVRSAVTASTEMRMLIVAVTVCQVSYYGGILLPLLAAGLYPTALAYRRPFIWLWRGLAASMAIRIISSVVPWALQRWLIVNQGINVWSAVFWPMVACHLPLIAMLFLASRGRPGPTADLLWLRVRLNHLFYRISAGSHGVRPPEDVSHPQQYQESGP